MSMRTAIFLIAGAALVAGTALAQDKPAAEKPAAQPAAPVKAAKGGRDRACAADASKFCGDVRPGAGRMYKCLTSHDAELAPACKERLTQGKARWDQFVSACKADGDKYCKGIPPGGGRIVSCLKGREADLAPDCKAQFNRVKGDTTVTQ